MSRSKKEKKNTPKKRQELLPEQLETISGGFLPRVGEHGIPLPPDIITTPLRIATQTESQAPDTFSSPSRHTKLLPETPSPSDLRIQAIKDDHAKAIEPLTTKQNRLVAQDQALTQLIGQYSEELHASKPGDKSDLIRMLRGARMTQEDVREELSHLDEELLQLGQNTASAIAAETTRPESTTPVASTSPSRQARAESAQFLSSTLGTPIDQSRTHPIPQQIHRFWSGGKMSDAAMKTLEESATKTRGTKWRQTLWYSRELEKNMEEQNLISPTNKRQREEQRDRLKLFGYNIKAIEDLPQSSGISQNDLRAMATKATKQVAEGGPFRYDGIKHMSDIARLMYLNGVGGHHFDVDMGLGGMDFSRSYYHNDQNGSVPLLGALTAVSKDPIAGKLQQIESEPTESLSHPSIAAAARDVAQHASDMAVMLNGMIASRPNNPRFADALKFLREDAVNPEVDFPTGMMANTRLLYGADAGSSLDESAKTQLRAQSVPVYLYDLEHLTPESDSR